jgi:hypothetical protein
MSTTPETAILNIIVRDPEIVIIFRDLACSRYQLLVKEIPMQLRVISYLRISCSSLRKLNKLGAYGTEMEVQDIEYFLLLKVLTEYDSCWWKSCTVSSQGILRSEDSVIENILEPLAKFHVYCCSIA